MRRDRSKGPTRQGILAASREEMMTKKMTLRCVFPLDGSPRSPDACFVGVGR